MRVVEVSKRLIYTFVAAILLAPLAAPVFAQQATKYVLTGTVSSAATSEPLPGATIRVTGTTLGTTTNTDGRYRLLLPSGTYNLLVSYIGFNSSTARAVIAARDTTLDIVLTQSQVSLPEVVVFPHSTNPADEIIARAIRAKKRWLASLRAYDFDAYTKTVLRVVVGNSNPDTTINGILETQTRGYWKEPDSYLEVVTARRQTANFTSAQNVFTAGRVLNFNDDIVKIDRFSIPGPTSPSAFDYYHFTIVDTNYENDTRIFRIDLEAKDNSSPLFKGYIDIAEGSYAMVHVNLGLSDPTALDPLEGTRYDEQFAEYDDMYWLPIEIKTTFVVKFVVPPVPPILFENVSVLYDYRMNPEFPKDFFDRRFISTTSAGADVDSAAWQKEQVLPLTRREVLAYARLDSLTRNMPFFWKTIFFLTRLPSQSQSWPITSISDFYHFNRVEGSYLGVGLTSSTLLDRTSLTAIGGYGFSDRIWKYDLTAGYDLPFTDGVTVGARVFRRLANREEENIYSRFEVTLGGLLYKDDYRDYYLSKGWNGFAKWRLNSSWEVGIQYDDEEQTSVRKNTDYSMIPQDYNYRDNPVIDDGRMRSVGLSLKLDTRKYYDSGMSMESDEGSSYWVGNASSEISSPSFLASSFSFDRYHASLMRHQMTFASGYLNLWLIGGTADGHLPIQRMFEIQATYGGYSTEQVLSTLSTRRILSDRMVVAGIEHDFASSLFRWSDIPIVRDAWFDVSLFAHGAAANGVSPMAEAGFGLVNILPFIRTDFTWGVAGACNGFAWTLETTLGL